MQLRARSVPKSDYLPALGYHWLTPLYDPLARLTTREARYKGLLLDQAAIREGHRVLDVGCGTGTLLLKARKRSSFDAVGLDGDGRILSIARSKSLERKTRLLLIRSFSSEIPLPDGTFDRILSSLMLHHLKGPVKIKTLAEVYRVLRPGGELHVADWGRPGNVLMKAMSLVVRLGDGKDRTDDNLKGRLPALFQRAGFEDVSETSRLNTMFGTLALYRARKPSRS